MFVVHDFDNFGIADSLEKAIGDFELNSDVKFNPEEHYVIRGENVEVKVGYIVKE